MKRKILILSLLLMLIIPLLIHLHQLDMLNPRISNSSPLVIAHRGASAYAPENTMAAIQMAVDMQADVIEIDVHFFKDKEVVLMHDATLDRTTSGSGKVEDFLLRELKELDAGSWMNDTFAGEKIPTLEEVIQLIGTQRTLLIEIKKGKEGRYQGLEQKVLEFIRTYRIEKSTIIQSFQKETVAEMIRLAPDLEVHKLIIGQLPALSWHHDGDWQKGDPLDLEGIQAINPAYQFLTRRFVRNMRSSGKKVFVFTVNDPEAMEKCIKMGVAGIITDHPDRLLKLIQKKQNQ